MRLLPAFECCFFISRYLLVFVICIAFQFWLCISYLAVQHTVIPYRGALAAKLTIIPSLRLILTGILMHVWTLRVSAARSLSLICLNDLAA